MSDQKCTCDCKVDDCCKANTCECCAEECCCS